MAIYITVNLKDGRTFDVPRPDEEGSSRDKFVLGAYSYTKRKYPNWSSMVITVVKDEIGANHDE
jgi:hypothetical protein